MSALRYSWFLLPVLLTCSQTATVDSLPRTAMTPDNVPPESCPVAKAPSQPFVPPAPYLAKAASGSFWFGSKHLWTVLPANGMWKGLPHYTPDDPTFRQKLYWWRVGYGASEEPQPKVTVTGHRLDAEAPQLHVDAAIKGWRNPEPAETFMVVGINFPTLGCWEITGQYQDAQVTFVVWVAE